MRKKAPEVIVRNTLPGDFTGIIELCRAVYAFSLPWGEEQLKSHLTVFPEGQMVAVESDTQRVVGVASSLIIVWDQYDVTANWRDFTHGGMFTNHDPLNGRTLYGAEVMVDPAIRGHGIGRKLYSARWQLVKRLKLLRIRAGARLRGYHRYASELTPEQYTINVIKGDIGDPTLSFQLKQGFHVISVVSDYLHNDPESRGYAAVIERINKAVAKPEDIADINTVFQVEQRVERKAL